MNPEATPLPPAPATAAPPRTVVPAGQPETVTASEVVSLPPMTVLENMRTVIHQYASMFGGNPVGNNQEITRALDGENPKQAHFVNPGAGMVINKNGELVDPWGTPLFFHALSGTVMEIRSAGPDRKMFTADDLIIK
jgi:hypothetical protein